MKANELLSKIEQYAARIGVTANAVSIAAFGSSNALGNLRRGSEPRPNTIDSFVKFMNANPEGDDYLRSRMRYAARGTHDKASSKSSAPMMNRVGGNQIDTDSLVIVDRNPCFRCGVRRDVGCSHYPKNKSS